MRKTIARTILVAAVAFGAAACGFDTGATFNADGSVTVSLKFLFPKSLMDSANGATVTGMSPSDIAAANTKLQAKYPGSKITVVTEGDEKGALMTIPFKTEKDAFTFLTAPSQLSPSKATSGSGIGINLSNTGGLFSTATHTTSGQNDTYTFKTAPAPMASPAPGPPAGGAGRDGAGCARARTARTAGGVARTTARRGAALDDLLTADN